MISRAMDALLAIPALVLALVMLGTIGPSQIGIIIVIVVLYTPIVARVVRSATLNIRTYGFIEAAKLRGESTLYILFREILPGVLPALAVEGALRFSYAIFLTASLGFLGLGVPPPSPDWGRMVNEARRLVRADALGVVGARRRHRPADHRGESALRRDAAHFPL